MTEAARRQELVQSVDRHQAELDRALDDLRTAVRRPFAIAERLRERPLPWVVSSLLVGLWLGSRGAGAGGVNRNGDALRRYR